ncbi:MAG: protein-glutamate O-methyltransferase CheR [Gemmatimonadaceae bacterium]|nr:protein-glutamate O-methyltransferase CheR [Gemmatimonadaceae bacterium]
MIAPDDYRFLAELLKRGSGLALGEGKEYLLESRLPPVATRFGLADLAALVGALRTRSTAEMVKAVCDAMTTGETLFFRDNAPFQALEKQLIPEIVPRARAQGRAIRIWCAACSTGQEPYSIAMIMDQMKATLGTTRVEIVATDYAAATLARAKEGIYNQFEVQRGLPVQLLMKYFKQVPAGFQVTDALRSTISFREQNLLQPFSGLGTFDVVFVRNVLIYFDADTKRDVLDRIARMLAPGGTVLLGGTENTLGLTESLARVPGATTSLYRRPSEIASAKAPVAGKAVA